MPLPLCSTVIDVPGVVTEKRARCWGTTLYYDQTGGELLFRRHPCGLWRCTWCRERLEQETIERYAPAAATTVEHHLVNAAGLPAFCRKVRRHGGEKVHIPAPGGGYVVLVAGCALGGTPVDAETALIEAVEERPGGGGQRIGASAGWCQLMAAGSPAGTADTADEVEPEPATEVEDQAEPDVELEPEPTQDLLYLGSTRRPLAEITRILDRHGLDHRITKRRNGELVMRSTFPPPDSFEFITLIDELLSPRRAAA